MYKLTSDRDGETEEGVRICAGTEVEYQGHVIGGMVRVRFANGTFAVMHPHCFKTLREDS